MVFSCFSLAAPATPVSTPGPPTTTTGSPRTWPKLLWRCCSLHVYIPSLSNSFVTQHIEKYCSSVQSFLHSCLVTDSCCLTLLVFAGDSNSWTSPFCLEMNKNLLSTLHISCLQICYLRIDLALKIFHVAAVIPFQERILLPSE